MARSCIEYTYIQQNSCTDTCYPYMQRTMAAPFYDHFIGHDIREGEIRLVGGRHSWEGRVEIFLSGVWGTVSDDGAGSIDARVVCRQLGYSTYSEASLVIKLFPCMNCVTHFSWTIIYYIQILEVVAVLDLVKELVQFILTVLPALDQSTD